VLSSPAVPEKPTVCPRLLMFVTVVRGSPGTIIGVKVPPLSRYPWPTGAGGAAEKPPTMSPALLMSCATVPSEPGTLIGVKLNVMAEVSISRAAAFGADQPLTPIEHGRFGTVPSSYLARSGSTWCWHSLHQTINRTRAAAALPSVIGGPGPDFMRQSSAAIWA
jgi:hypothetical protein